MTHVTQYSTRTLNVITVNTSGGQSLCSSSQHPSMYSTERSRHDHTVLTQYDTNTDRHSRVSLMRYRPTLSARTRSRSRRSTSILLSRYVRNKATCLLSQCGAVMGYPVRATKRPQGRTGFSVSEKSKKPTPPIFSGRVRVIAPRVLCTWRAPRTFGYIQYKAGVRADRGDATHTEVEYKS